MLRRGGGSAPRETLGKVDRRLKGSGGRTCSEARGEPCGRAGQPPPQSWLGEGRCRPQGNHRVGVEGPPQYAVYLRCDLGAHVTKKCVAAYVELPHVQVRTWYVMNGLAYYEKVGYLFQIFPNCFGLRNKSSFVEFSHRTPSARSCGQYMCSNDIIHIHIRTYVHTYIHVHIHTYMRSHMFRPTSSLPGPALVTPAIPVALMVGAYMHAHTHTHTHFVLCSLFLQVNCITNNHNNCTNSAST